MTGDREHDHPSRGDRARFRQGWFRDTLPAAPIAQLAVLPLDGAT